MRTQIHDALKNAMKNKDQCRVSTLRLVLATIKDRDIAARAEDRCEGVSDQEILNILTKMVKQRLESAETYESAGRLDLAERERAEIDVIEEFMPRQLDDGEIAAACSEVVDELEAASLKDMGRCMSSLKQRYSGAMDFSKASAKLKEMLLGRTAA